MASPFQIRFPSKAAKRRASVRERERERARMRGEGLVDGTYLQFKTTLLNKTPMVVLFGAPWCGPCRAIKPGVEDEARMRPKVTSLYLDVDDREVARVCAEYQVRGVPTIMAFHDGEPVDSRIASRTSVKSMYDQAEGRRA